MKIKTKLFDTKEQAERFGVLMLNQLKGQSIDVSDMRVMTYKAEHNKYRVELMGLSQSKTAQELFIRPYNGAQDKDLFVAHLEVYFAGFFLAADTHPVYTPSFAVIHAFNMIESQMDAAREVFFQSRSWRINARGN